MNQLLFINKVKENREGFGAKVKDIASRLGINANWLMAVMQLESGLNPRAQNTKYPVAGGYATGLIQFTPPTAAYLGTTTEDLKNMSNLEQLDYVYKYLAPYKGKMKNFADVYMAVFFPSAIGKKPNEIISSKNLRADTIAKSNPVFDLNKDFQITIKEFREAILNKFSPEVASELKKNSLSDQLQSLS